MPLTPPPPRSHLSPDLASLAVDFARYGKLHKLWALVPRGMCDLPTCPCPRGPLEFWEQGECYGQVASYQFHQERSAFAFETWRGTGCVEAGSRENLLRTLTLLITANVPHAGDEQFPFVEHDP